MTRKKVLLINDSFDLVSELKEACVLSNAGFDLYHSFSYRDAFHKVSGQTFDLVLSECGVVVPFYEPSEKRQDSNLIAPSGIDTYLMKSANVKKFGYFATSNMEGFPDGAPDVPFIQMPIFPSDFIAKVHDILAR